MNETSLSRHGNASAEYSTTWHLGISCFTFVKRVTYQLNLYSLINIFAQYEAKLAKVFISQRSHLESGQGIEIVQALLNPQSGSVLGVGQSGVAKRERDT